MRLILRLQDHERPGGDVPRSPLVHWRIGDVGADSEAQRGKLVDALDRCVADGGHQKAGVAQRLWRPLPRAFPAAGEGGRGKGQPLGTAPYHEVPVDRLQGDLPHCFEQGSQGSGPRLQGLERGQDLVHPLYPDPELHYQGPPAHSLPTPRNSGGEPAHPRELYPEELKIILENLSHDRYSKWARGYWPEVIWTALYSGMRRGEFLLIPPRDVRIQQGIFCVHGKGDKVRTVEIHPELTPHLQRVLEKNGKKEGRYFFGGGDTPIMYPESLSRSFRLYVVALGLPNGITLHSLRHTWTSYMLDSGASLIKVQKQAGHESLKITQKYAHGVRRKAWEIEKLDYGKYLDELGEEGGEE